MTIQALMIDSREPPEIQQLDFGVLSVVTALECGDLRTIIAIRRALGVAADGQGRGVKFTCHKITFSCYDVYSQHSHSQEINT